MPEEPTISNVEAAGQMYYQTNEFVYLGELLLNHNDTDLSIEVERHIHNAWCSFRKYTLELYDRPSAPLELNIRMSRAEVLGTTLYGCVTWSSRSCQDDTLQRAHHSFLTRWSGRRGNNQTEDTLMKTGSESVDRMMRRRRILFAGFVARMEDTRLPNCAMFGRVMGQRVVWRGRKKSGRGISWMTSELSVLTPTSGRL